jgi:hypothetical protein
MDPRAFLIIKSFGANKVSLGWGFNPTRKGRTLPEFLDELPSGEPRLGPDHVRHGDQWPLVAGVKLLLDSISEKGQAVFSSSKGANCSFSGRLM